MEKYKKVIVFGVVISVVLSCCFVGVYLLYKNVGRREPIVGTHNGSYTGGYVGTYASIHERPDFSYTSRIRYTGDTDGLIVGTKLGSKVISVDNDKAYLLISLMSDEIDMIAETEVERLPLDLGIVIDRSGSMSGTKLEDVKQALINISGMLTREDSLTVVTYDDYVDVLYQSDNYDREKFVSEISRLGTGGSTNLEGGLRRGIEEVDDLMLENSINKVILLSDGLANVGVSDASTLANIVEDMCEDDIVVSTIGVGADYDDRLMSEVAIAGNGSYYFLEDSSLAEGIFEEELQSAINTIAEDIEIKLELKNGVTLIRGVGFDIDDNRFNPNNVYAGRNIMYLVELNTKHLRHKMNADNMLVNVEIAYSMPGGDKYEINSPVYFDSTKEDISPLADDEVYYEYINSEMGTQLRQVYESLDKYDNDEANRQIDISLEFLQKANIRLPGIFDEELISLESKREYIVNLDDEYINDSSIGKSFQKSNQTDAYNKVYNR